MIGKITTNQPIKVIGTDRKAKLCCVSNFYMLLRLLFLRNWYGSCAHVATMANAILQNFACVAFGRHHSLSPILFNSSPIYSIRTATRTHHFVCLVLRGIIIIIFSVSVIIPRSTVTGVSRICDIDMLHVRMGGGNRHRDAI